VSDARGTVAQAASATLASTMVLSTRPKAARLASAVGFLTASLSFPCADEKAPALIGGAPPSVPAIPSAKPGVLLARTADPICANFFVFNCICHAAQIGVGSAPSKIGAIPCV